MYGGATNEAVHGRGQSCLLNTSISEAEVLIIGGTSLNVWPAAGLINYYRGNKLVLINKSAVARDLDAALVITDPIGQVLSQL